MRNIPITHKTTAMNQLFKLTNEKTWKTLLLTENEIMIVNKSYSSAEEFLEKFNEKGLLKERLEISVLDVSKMAYAENAPQKLTITYPKKEDQEAELMLEFASLEEKEAFIEIVSKPRQMTAATQEVGVFKAISSPLIGLAITAIFGYIIYEDAKIVEAGGVVNTSGRRSLYKQIFAWLGETLGTQGTMIAIALLVMVCGWFIFKNLKTRPVEVVYA